MKILCKNKHWNIPEEYNVDKILYLLIDRPDGITIYNDFSWENNEGYLHRDYDLPSFISINRNVSWHKNAVLHRDNNKPARMWNDGYKQYWHFGNVIKEEK